MPDFEGWMPYTGFVVAKLCGYLGNYVHDNSIGWALGRCDFQLPGEKMVTPAVSFVSKTGRKSHWGHPEPPPYMPDLAILMIEDGSKVIETTLDAIYCREHGTRIVWMVQIQTRNVHVLAHEVDDIWREGDILDGGDVLPAFRLPVKDIFSQE